jgi:hypothetical protein
VFAVAKEKPFSERQLGLCQRRSSDGRIGADKKEWRLNMRSTIKTVILAAASVAIIAAPAFAKTKRAVEQKNLPVATQTSQDWQAADTFGQIRGEYLKDAPAHNGNQY